MKQIHRNSRYLAAILISSAMLPTALDRGGLQTRVSAKVSKETVVSSMRDLPAYFEENIGQFDEKVKYLVRGTSGYSLFLTTTDTVYVLSGKEQETDRRDSTIGPLSIAKSNLQTPKSSSAIAVYMTLAGANQNSEFTGSQPLEHRTNYFKGSDESKWQTDISNYQSVRTNQIYEGIDMIWHGKVDGGVQYDFVIAANANPDQIEWEIKGAKDVLLTAEGELLIKTEYGDIRQHKPFTFQETNGFRNEVDSGFVLSKSSALAGESFRVKFSLGSYDRSKTLTIDPSVNLSRPAFSTLFGGPINDQGNALAVDNAGNVFVTGKVPSPTFPTTPGTFDTTHNGLDDVFVTKLNANGSALIYSTFIGGSDTDLGLGIAVDSSGNAFVSGPTVGGTVGYPVTAGAFDTTPNGGADVFVTKLNATGSALIYSTLIGGSGDDVTHDIEIDLSGNAFLMGGTPSGNYPTTPGAFDTTYNGSGDVFATKLNATGSALIYSTYIGGSSFETSLGGIAVDAAGNAYLTGNAFIAATPYPTTPGAFDTIHNGFDDVFVTKLNASGSALIYSTFIGGNLSDGGIDIAVDSSGNAFVTGQTLDGTTDYPVTAGAFDTTHNAGEDGFVTKLNAAGSSLIYSTFLGGSGNDQGYGIAVDKFGSAFLIGFTDDGVTDYPTTAGALNTMHNGNIDVFVTKLDLAGAALTYSSFIGGSDADRGTGIVLDSSGNAYLVGLTVDAPTDFPTTPGVFDTTHNGGADPFVTKFSGAPRSFDFDGDGKTDISIFRPAVGQWWHLRSSDGGNSAGQFGNGSDKIVPADYTGDGKTDTAIWRPATGEWFVLRSEDFSYFAFPFGSDGDLPAPADFDGDGKPDPTVFRPSSGTWYILNSNGSGTSIVQFGTPEDKPVAADYEGDGRADIAIFRPSNGSWWYLRSSDNQFRVFSFGVSTDKPVQGDYTGDGKADIAVWRPSTGEWFVQRSEDNSYFAFAFGTTGDVPSPGDYDGDGRFDATVFRPSTSTWFANRSTGGTLIVNFGIAGDIPVPSAFVP